MSGSLSSFEEGIKAFLSDWWIPIAVLLSLMLQLMLLLTGGSRKWHWSLRAIAWNAYNWSDYVATLALGGMAQDAIGSTKQIYAIWAPILLLHLGAPDNISAYAVEDAQLWLRHGLVMILQVFTALFVVVNCAREWQFILLSIFLIVTGTIKYAERTMALRKASRNAIVESALPFYKYMLLEPFLIFPPSHSSSSSTPSNTPNNQGEEAKFYYIMTGEKEWYRKLGGRDNPISYVEAAQNSPSFVTLEDVVSSRVPILTNSKHVMHLCLAFALFKLYLRRLSNLYMYEWRELKTRQLFLNYSSPNSFFSRLSESEIIPSSKPEEDILFVLDVELRFLYDRIYTKAAGTAFTKIGVLFRIFSTLLLMVSSFVIIRVMDPEIHQQEALVKQAHALTYLLVVGALVIEAYQLIRLLLSDWTHVWLACTYIKLLFAKQHPQNLRKLMYVTMCLWVVEKALRSPRVLRQKYWRSRIGQYNMIKGCHVIQSHSWIFQCWNGNLSRLDNVPKYESEEGLVCTFRNKAIKDALAFCSKIVQLEDNVEHEDKGFYQYVNIEMLVASQWRPWRTRFQRYCVSAACGFTLTDSEIFIVNWHLATIVCELLNNDEDVGQHRNNTKELVEEMKMAKFISNYCMYLLVHKAELLPCHPDIGRQIAARVKASLQETLKILYNNYTALHQSSFEITQLQNILIKALVMETRELNGEQLNHHDDNIQHELKRFIDIDLEYNKNTFNTIQIPWNIKDGIMAGKLLLLGIQDQIDRWKFIWEMWVEVLLCIASPNKSELHLQQLALGGEFLTEVWVLLGHMGFGQQK